MDSIKRTIYTTIFAVTFLAPLAGQESLSTEESEEIRIDDSGEIKIFSDLTIPAGEVRTGKLRVIGGNLTVAGTVTGRITVIGGDVELLSTAVVEGAIVALGGTVTQDPEAKVNGEVIEINTGKVSLSREKSRALFGGDDFEAMLQTHNHNHCRQPEAGAFHLPLFPLGEKKCSPPTLTMGSSFLTWHFEESSGIHDMPPNRQSL